MSTSHENRMARRRHELLQDVVDLFKRHLASYDLPEAAADAIANHAADRLADHWGGQLISIPKDFLWRLSQVEQEIYAAFTGTNYDVLAQQYHMTERGIRMLINRVRTKLAAQNPTQQGDMFTAPEAD
ncbi:MAG: Mor transcription activator family protein [Comamonas sp.]